MNWSTSAPAALGEIPDFAGDFGLTDAGADRAAEAKKLRATPRGKMRPKNLTLGEDDGVFATAGKAWFGPGGYLGPAKKLVTGYYMEAGPYVYRYNVGAETIDLVISPKSTKARPVAKDSAAYTAILKKLKAGGAKLITADEVKTMRNKVSAAAAPKPKRAAAHAHEEAVEVAPLPTAAPPKNSFLDSLPGWAPYAAGGVILSVIASALLLSSPRARLATLEK